MATNLVMAYHYWNHPFDLIRWDSYLWPFQFNIADFQLITGHVHQLPPVHQMFQARNFVVCLFVPHKFNYHLLMIPVPYNHSNINSNEVILLLHNSYCTGFLMRDCYTPQRFSTRWSI